MIYNLSLVGITIAGLILRSVFPRVIRLAWTAPDFLVLLVVFNAMFRGTLAGGVTGFLVGLAEDIFFGRFIGLNALAKCVAGTLTGYLTKSIFKENMWVPVINVLLGSLLCLSIVFIFGQLAGARWYLSNILFQSFFEVLFNVCLVPFVYGPFFQFADRQLNLTEAVETGEGE
ncbi:MAG: rod shape-determining protein MreD [Peptococcaceae bacterium]|jgi:rod shape-determining protein MreD|nr:rod shape-determining protein MreD [Peptococcaceae bacterium]